MRRALPRAYQWADGSAYVNHVELVRRARGAEMPASFWTDPLMYQGGSDAFLGPRDPIVLPDEDHGIDFEAEVAVIVDDVPMGVTPEAARGLIRLVVLVNDVSLRNLIPAELAKGFGFFQSKPSSALSPVAVTPDQLGGAWSEGRLSGALLSTLNGEAFGKPDAGVDMTFDFGTLIAHAARTRPLSAGAIIGSGTVSNRDADGAPAARSRRAGSVIPASPSSGPSRRSASARRRRRSCASATASASRCWTSATIRSSAPSNRPSRRLEDIRGGPAMLDPALDAELDRLFRVARTGDRAAYRALLDRLAPRLRAVVRRRLARADASDVEDVVQEALLAVHLAQDTWDGSVPVLVWAGAIARYKAIDALRRSGRPIAAQPIEELEDVVEPVPAPDAASRIDLARALEAMPAALRTLVIEAKVDGRPLAEVAARAGMTEGAVKVALHRALKRLARRLTGDER